MSFAASVLFVAHASGVVALSKVASESASGCRVGSLRADWGLPGGGRHSFEVRYLYSVFKRARSGVQGCVSREGAPATVRYAKLNLTN